MKPAITALFLCVLCGGARADQHMTGHAIEKRQALDSIESLVSEMTTLSDQIWRFAETALKEKQSAKALSDWAESRGFRVERGVAGLPTAFVAEYGQGDPIIGIMGEYDALPGISQKASPIKEALEIRCTLIQAWTSIPRSCASWTANARGSKPGRSTIPAALGSIPPE